MRPVKSRVPAQATQQRSLGQRLLRASMHLASPALRGAIREMTGLHYGAGGFQAARIHRGNTDWPVGTRNINYYIRRDIRALRARARWLEENTVLVKHHLRLLDTNVLGPQGIISRAAVRDRKGDLVKDINQEIDEKFNKWADGPVTADRRWNLRQFDGLALKGGERDGEQFVRMVIGRRFPSGMALQSINPDLMNERFNQDAGTALGEIRMSVEVDDVGGPVGYWPQQVYMAGESYVTGKPYFVPAYDVRTRQGEMLHYYLPLDPDQVRGITEMHAVMETLNALGAYSEAALDAARVGANQFLLIKQDAEGVEPADPMTAPTDATKRILTADVDIEPGTTNFLEPGQDVADYKPNYPAEAYDGFMTHHEHGAAAGLGDQHFELTGDLSGVNYTSSRTGKLLQWDIWKMRAMAYVHQVRGPIHDMWIAMACITGELDFAGYTPEQLMAVKHRSRSYPWVDPQRDAQASALLLQLGLTSRQRLIPGEDVEEIIEEQAFEQGLGEKHGVSIAPPSSVAADVAKQNLMDELGAGTNGNGGSNGNGRHLSHALTQAGRRPRPRF
jgi:lambda family phage portal protein